MTDDLWTRIDVALIQARSRQETLSELNRLLRKRFPDLPERYFTQETFEVRREWLTAKHLAQFNPGHTSCLGRGVFRSRLYLPSIPVILSTGAAYAWGRFVGGVLATLLFFLLGIKAIKAGRRQFADPPPVRVNA